MVGLAIVSHSEKLALGVIELAGQMAWDVPMAAAGGTKDGRLGTDPDKITTAINEVFSEDGVIVLFDLGSSYMNTEMSLEFLDDEIREKVIIIDAPIVEGGVAAAIQSSIGKTLSEIKEGLKDLKLGKISE